MDNSGPVLVNLYSTTRRTNRGHTVLAYAYKVSTDGKSGEISVCDSNHPGDSNKKIIFEDGKFNEYQSSWKAYAFNLVFLGGNGSFVGQYQRESFQNILDDAEVNFHNSDKAIIDIASHTSGQHVSERHVTLTGKIESVRVLAKRLRIFVIGKDSCSLPYECEIGEDGEFSQVIILQRGENRLMFEVDGARQGEVYFPNIPHNMTGQDFVLNCDVETSVILVTLTWDTSLTDVDLYVVDPTGDFSAFYHPNTADGGALDVDDTDGFGPEHWTLLTTDNIRYGEPYKIRVHYYYSGTDNGVRRTNYSVGVKLYEGTERENVLSFRGTLSLSNSENSEPNGIGADWRNITSIVLTQDESVSEPSASISPQGVINITTPIPSKEDIIKAKSK
jgi:uncharacterized protein YfaP (DUF2135 family)